MNSVDSSNRLIEEMLSHMKPPIPTVDRHPESKVADFYANKSLFITGATGFVGKALVEKLMRSCDRIKRIYVLIREKRGKTIQERLQDLIRSQYFDRIRETYDGSNRLLEEKLYAIRGDITLPKLGIGYEDMRLLSRDCTIVFNSAATVRFGEPIDVAVRNNIYSVGQLVEFCNELEHLEAIVHLSTAYSNCHKRDTIHEIIYEPPMRGDQIQATLRMLTDIQNMIHVYSEIPEKGADDDDEDYDGPPGLASSGSSASLLLTDESGTSSKPPSGGDMKKPASGTHDATGSYDLLAEFTRIVLRMSNQPNTYTFTKAISESYLLDRCRSRPDRYLNGKIPVAIVRPSIVGAAWREPIVGLVDNYNGPTGALLSLYTGALQAMPGCGERVADFVPIDMVTNTVVCAGWFLASGAAGDEGASGRHSVRNSNTSSGLIADHKRDSAVDDDSSAYRSVKPDNGIYVFNLVSGFRNPMKWRWALERIAELAYKYPSKFLTRLPSSYFIKAGKLYNLYDTLNHKLPAYMMDLVRSKLLGQRCEGRSSALVGYSRIRQMTDIVTPFTSNQWLLSDSNVQALFECLDPADRQLFHFDVASINWQNYLTSYIIGARIYLMHDEPKNLPAALLLLQQRKRLNSLLFGATLLLAYFLFIWGGQLEVTVLSWL